jgi:hypothetical protein
METEENAQNKNGRIWRTQNRAADDSYSYSDTDARHPRKEARSQLIGGGGENGERAIAPRPRPRTNGGILRQLIVVSKNQLAKTKRQIEDLNSEVEEMAVNIEQLEHLLSDWEAGVSAIESKESDQEDTTE